MRTRLRIQFPANREINREFGRFGRPSSYLGGQYASMFNALLRYSLRRGTGNFFKRTGNCLAANRKHIRENISF
jgi:hypothetical protein